MSIDRSDSTPKDPDDVLKAGTARLLAEMEELIRRAKLLMQEGHPILGYTARQMLAKGIQVVGGRSNLARRMNVADRQLDLWMDGWETMPEKNLHALIVLLDQLLPPGKPPRPPSG